MSDTARALLETYILQHALGRGSQAKTTIRRAVRLVEGLRSEQPDDVEYMALHERCLTELLYCLNDSNQREQLIGIGRQAAELAKRVAEATPDDMAHQEELATCHTDLGNAFEALKNASEAMVHYEESIRIRSGIGASKMPGVTLRIAESLMNQGVIFWSQKQDPSQAEKRFQEADRLLLSIPPDHRDDGGNADIAFGRIDVSWSGMLNTVRRFDESITRSEAGLREIEPYLKREPNDAVARDVCLKLHGNRAWAFSALGKHRESASDWTRVVELSPEPVPARYRVPLAVELVQADELARALA